MWCGVRVTGTPDTVRFVSGWSKRTSGRAGRSKIDGQTPRCYPPEMDDDPNFKSRVRGVLYRERNRKRYNAMKRQAMREYRKRLRLKRLAEAAK
jgi:hypothetical protein